MNPHDLALTSGSHNRVDHDDEVEDQDDHSGSVNDNTTDHHEQSTELNHGQYDHTDDDDGQNDMRSVKNKNDHF